MGKTFRWLRNAGIGAVIATAGLGANAWTTPPEQSVRAQVKNVTLAPVHAYLSHNLEQQWSERAENLQTDTTTRNPARIILEERVKPLRESTPERISLDTYTQEIAAVLDEVQDNINWEYVERRWFNDTTSTYKTPQRQVSLAQTLINQANAKDLLATGYAEHMPRIPDRIYKHIGGTRLQSSLGSALFEAKLRIAGREYTELVLSRHDRLVSFGPWQITELAVNGSKDALGGANLMGLALPDSLRLPSKIEYVSGSDHAKAAALMHLYNTVRLVRSTTEEEFQQLERYATHPQVQLGIMLGHHAPRRAEESIRDFLKEPQYDLRHHADSSLHRHIDRLEAYRPR